jgi:hypothetical protein
VLDQRFRVRCDRRGARGLDEPLTGNDRLATFPPRKPRDDDVAVGAGIGVINEPPAMKGRQRDCDEDAAHTTPPIGYDCGA